MQTGNRTRLYLNEVATRDGFQMEGRFIPTDDKVALIDRLSGLGYAKIEVTSFTSPKAIPALADGETVMQRIRRHPGVVYTALIPNQRARSRPRCLSTCRCRASSAARWKARCRSRP